MSEENSNIHTLLRVQDCDLKRGRAQMLTPQGRMSNLAKDSRKKKKIIMNKCQHCGPDKDKTEMQNCIALQKNTSMEIAPHCPKRVPTPTLGTTAIDTVYC